MVRYEKTGRKALWTNTKHRIVFGVFKQISTPMTSQVERGAIQKSGKKMIVT